MHQNTFFKDLKVIELASVLAGPAVGMFFAELGAKVIKVENKTTGGDVTRKWRLPVEKKDAEFSAYYCSVNWNKEIVFLDLKSKNDLDQLYEMVKDADVVIANFNVSKAAKMGVDYAQLSELNPRLIYAQLTAFGKQDTSPAFDIVLQAEAGFLYMCGEADRQPVRMPVALIDLLSAHQLKEGILLALMDRMKTNKGSLVETSLYESAVSSLANQATNYLMADHIPQPMGTMHPNIAPYGDVFYTKDEKPVVLAVGTDRQFVNLCKVLKCSFDKEPNFETNANRVKNRKDLKDKLESYILNFTRDDLLLQLKENAVPAGAIRNMAEVFEKELAQQMVLSSKMPDGTLSKRVKTVAFNWTPNDKT